MKKERIAELDVLRGLAFLAVVMQHVEGVYIRNPGTLLPESIMLGILFNLVKFAVPAFVFLTGMTLLYNYYEKLEYGSFIRKRTKEILVPYFAWTLIYEWYSNGIPHVSLAWIKEIVKNLVFGTQSYHLWFVPMIFQFYLFYMILRFVIRIGHNVLNTRLRFWSFLALFTALYAWFMKLSLYYLAGGQYHPTSWLGHLFIRYPSQLSLFWLFYFVLGALAGLKLIKWREFVTRSLQMNSFLFVVLFMWVGYELMRSTAEGPRVNLNYSTSLKPSMFWFTISEMLLIYGLSMAIAKQNSVVSRIFDFIGKYSYGAYLAHALVLNYAVRLTGKLLTGNHPLIQSLLCFVICSCVTVVLVYLLGKIPYANWLIGSTRKKSKQTTPRLVTDAPVVRAP